MWHRRRYDTLQGKFLQRVSFQRLTFALYLLGATKQSKNKLYKTLASQAKPSALILINYFKPEGIEVIKYIIFAS
jgi:hypothetical protein